MAIIAALLSGILSLIALCLTQLIVKLWIDPIREFIDVITEIRHAIKFHYNSLTCEIHSLLKDEIRDGASRTLRELSCKLESAYCKIPRYTLAMAIYSKITREDIPSPKEVDLASQKLLYLSNAVPQPKDEVVKNREVVKRLLNDLKQPLIDRSNGDVLKPYHSEYRKDQ